MIKHFEDVWVSAEKIAEEHYIDEPLPSQVRYYLACLMSEDLSKEEYKDYMGKLLFALAYYSKKHNINVWPALKEVSENMKLSLLDPEIDLILQNGNSGE